MLGFVVFLFWLAILTFYIGRSKRDRSRCRGFSSFFVKRNGRVEVVWSMLLQTVAPLNLRRDYQH
ncbi:hypothetical protein HG15A2_19470 [Adhaeretor mobilis]|uniref:Uncharacterized protein n=1 Tax=Adhaeretor mobilis TaxID=1930276 RepID=A0A517MUW1_9BACT|nr:hypothetical protein HG15A2_19470 [Adhaeretor mobilis]